MPRKASFEEVKKRFEDNNMTLLDDVYINSTTPMKYKCNEHTHVIQLKSYKELKYNGCKYCGREKVSRKMAHSFEVVEKVFLERGLKLLNQKIGGKNQKLKCVCPKHDDEILEMTYGNVSAGHGCKHCAYEFKSKEYRGEKSGNFKGGISPLNIVLRESLGDWRMDVLKKHRFSCFISGVNMNDAKIEVHHVKSFHEIRDEILREMGFEAKFKRKKWKTLEFTEEELEYLKSEIVRRHTVDVGYPITQKLHKEFHRIYGRRATRDDFYKFVDDKKTYYQLRQGLL